MGRKKQVARAQAMYALYQTGQSLEQVAASFGVTRQSIYDVFVRHGLATRPKVFQPTIEYGGVNYTPDPDGYYRRTDGDRHYLHHRVWVEHNGPIPEGRVIHHCDRNKANNAIENLACLTPSEHSHEHNPLQPVPERGCVFCGTLLVRKRQPSGRPETPAEVNRRLYCGTPCRSAHRLGKGRQSVPRKPA